MLCSAPDDRRAQSPSCLALRAAPNRLHHDIACLLRRRVDAEDLHIGPYHVPKGTKVLVAFDIENFLDPKLSRKPDPGRGNRIPVEHDITRLQEAFSIER